MGSRDSRIDKFVKWLFRQKKIETNTLSTQPEQILDSWADLMEIHMKLSVEDIDINGVSDQAETRLKIAALRAGAKAIRDKP